LSPPNTTAEPTQLGIPETSKKPHADSINSSSHAEALADVEADFRAIYIEDPDDAERTRLANFKIDKATRIIIHLRSTFMTSTYVQRFSILVQMAKSQTFKSRFKNESKGQATEVSAGDLARWAHNLQQFPYRRRIQLHGFWKTKANGHVRIDRSQAPGKI
jgi:hypothetical protein